MYRERERENARERSGVSGYGREMGIELYSYGAEEGIFMSNESEISSNSFYPYISPVLQAWWEKTHKKLEGLCRTQEILKISI